MHESGSITLTFENTGSLDYVLRNRKAFHGQLLVTWEEIHILEEESWSSWRFSKLHQPWWAYRSSQIKHPIRPLCPPPVLQETEAHPAARGREHPTSLTDPQKKWSNCPARSAGCTACTWELMQRGRLSVKSEGIGRQSLDLPSTKHGACKQEQNDFWRPFWH